MRVCIDIQAAIAQRAGVGRYTKLLVEHLAQTRDPNDELRLAWFDFKRQGQPFPVPGATQRPTRWIPGRLVQKAWKSIAFPPFNWFAGPADIYHFPNFVRPPLSRGHSVVTIHDVSFLRFPETMEPRNFAFLDRHIRRTVQQADRIITDCHFVAREIQELMHVPEHKLTPILLGLHPIQRANHDQIAAFKTRHQLDRPYLLHVGTLEPRKNHTFLIDLFDRLDTFDGDLVLAGMKGWKYQPIFDRIAASPKADRIHHLDFVADDDLPALYSGAEALVFPSLYEGFGFPPLEAMQCHTPVVASAAGSLAEVLHDGALLVPDYDPDAWIHAIETLRHNRDHWIQRGQQRAASFSWQTCAQQTWSVYREVSA